MQPHDTDARSSDTAAAPGRRQFLVLGGGAVLGAAVLAACGSDEENLPAETGTTVPTTGTTLAPPQGTTPEDGATNDAATTRTLRSFELAAVEVYGVLLAQEPESTSPDALALPGPIAYTDDVTELLQLLRERHTAHAEALVDLVSAAGGEPVTEPNQGILDGIVRPQLPSLTTQRAVLQTARALEQVGAATAAWAGGVLTTAELRQDVMAVGTSTARQSAAVSLLLDPTGASAVPHGVFDTSGPARIPEAVFLEEGEDGDDVSADAEEAAPAEDEGETTGGEDGESTGGEEGSAEGQEGGSTGNDGEG